MAGPGRESIGQRVAVEHLRLESLFAETIEELHKGPDGSAAQDAFVRLRDQLEAHVTREEQLYFPALRALRPAQGQALLALIAAHDGFRSRLARIEASLAGGALESAAHGVESLAGLFAAHEVSEEQMLQQLDQEIRAESIPSAC